MYLSLTYLRSCIMQKPETVSLCAGNIHLTTFHNVSCQVTRFLHSRALSCWKLKSFPLQKQPIFLCEVSSSWSELLPWGLMINYIKKLNRNPISNVDNIPCTHMKYLMKTRSWEVEFAHKEPVLRWMFFECTSKLFFPPKIFANIQELSLILFLVIGRHPFSKFLPQLFPCKMGYPEGF